MKPRTAHWLSPGSGRFRQGSGCRDWAGALTSRLGVRVLDRPADLDRTAVLPSSRRVRVLLGRGGASRRCGGGGAGSGDGAARQTARRPPLGVSDDAPGA